jgi:glycosyltransferase involved in cell wall biosynthesis
LRLAVDASLLAHREPTGVERMQATLLDALAPAAAAAGHELLRLQPAAGSRAPLALWRETGLVRELSRGRADVLLSPVAAVPLRASCPVIATLHELPWLAGPEGRSGDWRLSHRARAALAARVAAAVICVSEATRGALLGAHPAARAVVIAPGVGPGWRPAGADAAMEADDSAALDALGLRGARFVLAVGRLRRKKNLAALLAAFARAAPPELRLVLVGPDGDASATLRAQAARPELRGRVLFPGHVDDAALAALYRAAELVACPSLFEGFGLPALEAMACGAPVLAAPRALAEEARGPALLAEGADPAALEAALRRALLEAPARRAAAAAGPAHAARFSAARAADATLALCVRVAAGERP